MTWGAGLWGSSEWGGGGAGALTLTSVRAYRENVIRLTFAEKVYWTGIFDEKDAAITTKYAIAPVAGTKGVDGSDARAVNIVRVNRPLIIDGLTAAEEGRILELVLDRPMTSFPAAYTLTITNVYSENLANVYSGTNQFPALYRQIAPPQIEQGTPSRDIANPQTLRGLVQAGIAVNEAQRMLGVMRVDATGDYAFDGGIENLRKRAIRRIITRKNGFAHLPGYGVGIGDYGKQLGVAARLAFITSDSEAQIRQEPDVADCRVRAFVDPTPGIVRFQVWIQPKEGAAIDFVVPFRYLDSPGIIEKPYPDQPVPTPLFDPATLDLNLWQRNFANIGNHWAGSPSLGLSSVNVPPIYDFQIPVAPANPTPGTAVNGHIPASFDGVNDLMASVTLSQLLEGGSTAFSVWALAFIPTGAITTNDNTNFYTNQAIILDSGGYWGMNLRTGGGIPKLMCAIYDGAPKRAEVDIVVNQWNLFQIRFGGGTLEARVNGGGWAATPGVGAIGSLGGQIRMGQTYNITVFLQMLLLDLGVSNLRLNDTQFDNVLSYARGYYNLTL